jgi:hypothetical protein
MRRVISGRTGHGTRRQMSDATTPGCSAYVVTPVPSVRRASSCENSTLHNLETAYPCIPVTPRSGRRSASKSIPRAA